MRNETRFLKLSLFFLFFLFLGLVSVTISEAAVEAACFECHDDFPEYVFSHEPAAEGDCEACHVDHGDEEVLKLVMEGSALCYQCHDDLSAGKSVHDPVAAGKCMECHDPHGSNTKAILNASPEDLCIQCHQDSGMAKKAVVHEPLGDGCMECHRPHSSPYLRLMTENLELDRAAVYEKDQAELCFKCHDQEAFSAVATDETDFRDGEQNLHALHLTGGSTPVKYGIVKKREGQTCVACHLPHSTQQASLIRTAFDCGDTYCYTLNYTSTEGGGTCIVGCHKTLSYSRDGEAEAPAETRSGLFQFKLPAIP